MLEFVNDVLICYLIGSQLLNQIEGAGPPPADADKIEALPKVKISQELVGKITVIVFCKTVTKNNVACKLVQLSPCCQTPLYMDTFCEQTPCHGLSHIYISAISEHSS